MLTALGLREAGIRLFGDAQEDTYQYLKEPTEPAATTLGLLEPGASILHESHSHERLVFSAIYSADEFGRRTEPSFQIPRPNHLIFFGCSYLFGTGVNDNETIPSYLGRLVPNYQPMVYAIPGGSMSNMLWILSGSQFEKEVGPRRGIALYYLFSDLHVLRTVGFPRLLDYGYDNPLYELGEDGKSLQSAGMFDQNWPNLSFAMSRILTYSMAARSLVHVIRTTFSDREYELAAKVVLESKKKYLERFPEGRFVVFTSDVDNPLLRKLESDGVEILRLSSDYTEQKFRIPVDDHFSAEGNRSIASDLYRQLNQKGILDGSRVSK